MGRECIYQSEVKQAENTSAEEELLISLSSVARLLNSPTAVLRISLLELKLLHFFDLHVLPIFVLGQDKYSFLSFKISIPQLFANYESVRYSMFMISSLFLWHIEKHLTDVDIVILNTSDTASVSTQVVSSDYHLRLKSLTLSLSSSGSQYSLITCKYFDHSLCSYYKVMDKLNEEIMNSADISAVGFINMLFFTFWAMHFDRRIPLLDVTNDETPLDFISVSRGMRAANKHLGDHVLDSMKPMFPLFYLKLLEAGSNMPLIKSLKNEFLKMNFQSKFSSEAADELIIQLDAINIFETLFINAVQLNFSNIFVTFPLKVSLEFISLLRAKNLFSLFLLFVFSALCLMNGFYLHPKKNIWYEYIVWYKNYNTLLNGLPFNSAFATNLYNMVIIKRVHIDKDEMFKWWDFDPENGTFQ